MHIMVVDCNLATCDTLTACARATFPDATVSSFADPLMGLKYGANNPVDVLVMQPEMRLPFLAGTITHNLREYHPEIRVIYVTPAPMHCDTDFFDEPPDAVVEMPVSEMALSPVWKQDIEEVKTS